MASNDKDNAMTRFLFAILRQKNLKDIDWNQVAHDPVLAQEITNGHAARMRFSRFRSAMLGIEPQKRNRKDAKNRVAKPKKDPKAKKEKGNEKEEPVKPDPNAVPMSLQGIPKAPSPKVNNEAVVKKEAMQTPVETQAQPSQAELMPATLPDMQTQFHNRLLTPCSDTELFLQSQGYTASPVSDLFHQETPLDYSVTAHCSHEHQAWQHSPPYPSFPFPNDLDGLSVQPFCDHQSTPNLDAFGIPPGVMLDSASAPDHHHMSIPGSSHVLEHEHIPVLGPSPPPEHNHTPVKHEEWDADLH